MNGRTEQRHSRRAVLEADQECEAKANQIPSEATVLILTLNSASMAGLHGPTWKGMRCPR